MKRRTLIIDGTYLFKRSFSVNSNQYTKSFGHIGGVFNFFITLRTLCYKHNINKIVVFWDSEDGGKLRYNIYRDYKSNRTNKSWYTKIQLSESQIEREKELEKSALKQEIRIKQYLEELFVRQLSVDLIEADDLIAYYCEQYHNEELITIYTNDRDICQLMQYDNVSVFLANKKILINKNNYYLFFKHKLENLSIIKTFCGDSSDNIKGANGVGEKTFIKYFPEITKRKVTIDEILEKSKTINEERINNKQKPLLSLENIYKGINIDKKEIGDSLFRLNYKLINLLEPFLTREAMHQVREIATTPLTSEDRGSVNLLPMMNQDGFFTIFNGTVENFFRPFYPTILKEKETYKNNQLN